MNFKHHVNFTTVMLEWLKVEWYNNRYDGVRDFIDPEKLKVDKDKLLIKTLFYIERHTILNGLQLENITWWKVGMQESDFDDIHRIGGGGWDAECPDVFTILGIARHLMKTDRMHSDTIHLRKIHDILMSIGKREVPKTLVLIQRKGSDMYKMLEGNHRAIAFMMCKLIYGCYEFPKEVFVGVEK